VLIVFQRVPRPDATLWRGRRLLAAFDAVLWPAAWAGAVAASSFGGGIVGLVVVACAVISAPTRLHRAISQNERYRFTTWEWGRPLVVLIVIGAVMKLALAIAGP